jgi:hypothetical protein
MSESKYIDLKFCLNMNNTQVGGTPMPTDSTNNDPGTVTPIPTDGTPIPTDGTPIPTDGTPIPTDGTPIPTDVTNNVVSIAIGGNSNKLIPLVYQL